MSDKAPLPAPFNGLRPDDGYSAKLEKTSEGWSIVINPLRVDGQFVRPAEVPDDKAHMRINFQELTFPGDAQRCFEVMKAILEFYNTGGGLEDLFAMVKAFKEWVPVRIDLSPYVLVAAGQSEDFDALLDGYIAFQAIHLPTVYVYADVSKGLTMDAPSVMWVYGSSFQAGILGEFVPDLITHQNPTICIDTITMKPVPR